MVIITLLTQVRKEKNGKINFHPGSHLGSSPDGEVFQSTPKGVLMAQALGGLSV